MNELPKHIADLCGIITDTLEAPTFGRGEIKSPLQVIKDDDQDLWTVTYNGEEIGWITPITYANRDAKHYRAVSVHGPMKHTYSLGLARSFIMAEYH
jgi:hypothetical protein